MEYQIYKGRKYKVYEKICEYCGQSFKTIYSKKKFCDGPHKSTCVICGEEFELSYERIREKDKSKTCSRKCARQLGMQTNLQNTGYRTPAENPEIREKMRQTMLDRYGVDSYAKTAEYKERVKATSLSKYGVEHHTKRPEYLEQLQLKSKAKYGTDFPLQSDELKAKSRETCKAKYGVEYPMQNEDFKRSVFKSYESRTGYSHPWANPEVIAKTELTNLDLYGVKRPLQNPEIVEHSKQTWLDKYGAEHPMQVPEILDKVKQTTFERYGHTCYLASDDGRRQTRKRMQELYGVDYYAHTEDWLLSTMSNPEKVETLLEFKECPKQFLMSRFDSPPTLRDLAECLGVSEYSAGTYAHKYDLVDNILYVYSQMEHDVHEFLKSITDTEIIRNTKQVITPYELDLYLPEYNLGIECNPTSTHNSTVNSWSEDDLPTPVKYHKMKTDICEERGIFLFHIFGYEWTHKQAVIQSMLRNLIQCNACIVPARKTQIYELTSKQARMFLTQNHRQGYANSLLYYGLMYKDELVALMSFGKRRHTIGKFQVNDWELVRFCNKTNTTVIGGASKLFKHFIQTEHPSKIISFSDRAHTTGRLYETLGFELDHISDPGYVWVNINTDKAVHRLNAQKANIKNLLHDDTIDLTKSESQIMIEHGYVKVYDSGTKVWVWCS